MDTGRVFGRRIVCGKQRESSGIRLKCLFDVFFFSAPLAGEFISLRGLTPTEILATV